MIDSNCFQKYGFNQSDSMRLRLTLRQKNAVEYLPLNTGYYLAGMIYKVLLQSSEAFASQLHEYGYAPEHARQKFKYFTFSNLQIPKRTGLFADGGLRIDSAVFEKERIETLADPAWSESMAFSMLSPLAVSLYRNPLEGMNSKEYLRYNDERLSATVLHNLQAKYRGLYGAEPPECSTPFSVTFDANYIKRIEENRKSVEKLITIKDASDKEIKVKAIESPFVVTGHCELLKVGYECGFGENNGMGFGMVRVDER